MTYFAADTRPNVDTLYDKVVVARCKIMFAPEDRDSFGGGYGLHFFSPDGGGTA